MNVPDLSRVYHTFCAIPDIPGNDVHSNVLTVRRFIRNEVRCLIDELTGACFIKWFGFHVHCEGQYTGAGNTGPIGIHVRFELEADHTFNEVAVRLDMLGWESSQKYPVDMSFISGINAQRFEGDTDIVQEGQLRDNDIAYAWKAIGEASEWVLDVLSAYDLDPVPVCQVRQHTHFIENLLYV